MSRLQKRIKERLEQNRKNFIAYISAGDPDIASTPSWVSALVQGGVDIIELGIPYSDPLADGPVNQRAAERALAKGITLSKVLDAVALIRRDDGETPLVIFSYINPIYAMGFESFASRAQAVGVDAVLIVDLPPEEAGEIRSLLQKKGLDTIFLASPTSSPERLKLLDEQSSGFIYYVSRTGVTGMQSSLAVDLNQEMKAMRKLVKNPVMVGFGISDPEQAKDASEMADGIIIGSAIVKIIEDHGLKSAAALETFARSVRKALDNRL